MIAQGIVTDILELEQVSERFTKQEFAVKTDGDYPQELLITAINDKTQLLNGVSVGDRVEVSVNVQGRAHVRASDNKKFYFNTLSVWKLNKL